MQEIQLATFTPMKLSRILDQPLHTIEHNRLYANETLNLLWGPLFIGGLDPKCILMKVTSPTLVHRKKLCWITDWAIFPLLTSGRSPLNWLPVSFWVQFKVHVITCKTFHDLVPTYVRDHVSWYAPGYVHLSKASEDDTLQMGKVINVLYLSLLCCGGMACLTRSGNLPSIYHSTECVKQNYSGWYFHKGNRKRLWNVW